MPPVEPSVESIALVQQQQQQQQHSSEGKTGSISTDKDAVAAP
jgi:hypothetical protein